MGDEIRWVCSMLTKEGQCTYYFLRNPGRNRMCGRSKRRWEDNIKLDLKALGWGMDWIDLSQHRDQSQAVVNMVMNLRFL
jgi:hypothetical protein